MTINSPIFPHPAKKFSTFFLSFQQTQVRLIQRFEIFSYFLKCLSLLMNFYFFKQSKRRFPHKIEFSTLGVENSFLGGHRNVDNVENFREFSTLSTGFPHKIGSFPHFLFAMRLLMCNRFYNTVLLVNVSLRVYCFTLWREANERFHIFHIHYYYCYYKYINKQVAEREGRTLFELSTACLLNDKQATLER